MTINVNVKLFNGDKFSVQTELNVTVGDFKKLLSEKSNIPVEQQRLIFAGHVLKDHQTLESYSIKDGLTVHLVRGTPATTNPAPSATSAQTPGVAPSLPSTGGFGGNNPVDPFGGLFTGLGQGGLGGSMPNVQQLFQNPQMMRDMMNSPLMQQMQQQMLQNPELVRSMLMNNPQIREVIERNPEIGHALSDPAILRQTLEYARNPELMREMMRNTDRAMSNIESHPEGFNLLRRMYQNVQEPMMNAAQQTAESANPFSALFSTGGQTQATQGTQGRTPEPNTAPLPNPWAPSSPATQPATGTTAQSEGAAPNINDLFGTGLGGLGGLGQQQSVFGLDANSINSMLSNPALQNMMQQFFSNPELMQQMMNSNPMVQQMLNSNPQFRGMMQNPDFLRQLSNPQTIQAIIQMQNAVQQLQGTGLLPSLGIGSGVPSFSPAAAPPVNNDPPEVRYATQLQQLRDMGFTDTQRNISALNATAGNVSAAVERLLSGL